MAAKNWRESADNASRQPKNAKAVQQQPGPSEPLRLGLIVKGIAFTLTLVALFLAGKFVWKILQPPQRTVVYFLGNDNEEFKAEVHSSGLYADESTTHFGEGNQHLSPLSSINEDSKSHLGPNKNTSLFYLNGDLTVEIDEKDETKKTVSISRNGSGESKYQTESWLELEKIFERVCNAKISSTPNLNRILILDVGEVDENVLLGGISIREEIESLLQKMQADEIPNVDRFWVLISASDHQQSWFAPELGTSVFSYFVSRGLEGQAGESEEITLANLIGYVEKSVARWVLDFRGSNQTPQLITVSKRGLDEVSLVYFKGGTDNLSKELVGYHKTELKQLWDTYREKQSAFPQLPHYLSQIESRLIRLEEVRYGKASGSGRSRQIFKKLKTELEELSRVFAAKEAIAERVVSIEQISRGTEPARVEEFIAYLFPLPQEPLATEEGVEPGNKPATAPVAPVELSEELKNNFDRQRWLGLVWEYLNSDRAMQDPITQAKFEECVSLIESSAGETGTVVDGDAVPWIELQYLKLLRDNVDWLREDAQGFSTQKLAVLNAIRCRQKSESLVRGSALGDQYRSGLARVWHLVRDEYIGLESNRRHAEDLLFANEIDQSSEQLVDLSDQYDSLIENTRALVQMQRLTNEVLHIVPHLRRFLIREATTFKTTAELESLINRLNSTQRTAYKLANQLHTGATDFDATRTNFENLSEDILSIRSQFKKDYFDRLVSEDKSAADVVFHASNLLTSPIPEWFDADQRETIRRNLDRWIEDQHQEFFEIKWDEFNANKKAVTQSDTISSADLRVILEAVPKPIVDGPLDGLKTDSLISIGNNFNKLKSGGEFFDALFNQQQASIEDTSSLVQWQSKFGMLDFEIREGYETFSRLDQGLDVGQHLAAIDLALLALDRFERTKSDCWGAGDVHEMSRAGDLPPFVLFGLAEHQEVQQAFSRLEDFDSRDDSDRKAFDVAGLTAELDSHLLQLNTNWKKLTNSRVAWANEPPPTEFANSLAVETKINSELAPSDVGQTNPMTMSAALNLNRSEIRKARSFSFSGKSSLLPTMDVESGELRQRCEFDSIVGFRGHRVQGQFKLTREKTVAPKMASFTTTHTSLPLGPPSVRVEDEEGVQGDIVFILDCSNSMNERVRGKDLETKAIVEEPRLFFAKQALRTAIQKLAQEKRFRFGLYAFGHRNGFRVNRENELIETKGAKVKYAVLSKNNHPFEDCEKLFSLDGNSGIVSSEKDVGKMIDQVNGCDKALGVTPLYHSIKFAVETEFGASLDAKQKRYVVVLTDGKNNQFGGSNHNKAVPINRTPKDATSAISVQEALRKRGVELFVARISKEGATGTTEIAELQQAGALPKNILSVNEDDSQSVANSILDAIGRSQFSVSLTGQSSQQQQHKIPKTVVKKKPGTYVVQSSGVAKPDMFEVELLDGVSVLLKNTPNGLVLDDGSRPEFKESPQPVDCNLASGVYRIGRVSATGDNQIAFGFEKRTRLAGSNSDNFSFRPQRIWAQLTVRKTGEKINLFLPTYIGGQYPVAVFKLPQTDANLDEFDVRLWIAPNINDRGRPIGEYLNTIGLDATTNSGIECKLERDKSKGTSAITVNRPAGDSRDFFVACPESKKCIQTTLIKDGLLTEKYAYDVAEANANFTLSILPPEKHRAIMERVSSSTQRYGKEIDPIFGDEDSVWVDFEQIKIKN